MSDKFSYVGSGLIVARDWGTNDGWDSLGNCTAFSIEPQTAEITLPDGTNPGGGIFDKLQRVNDYRLNITFHELFPENLARFGRGNVKSVPGATVADEPHWAYKGKWIPLKYSALTVTAVEPAGGGAAYTAGTDYIVDRGMLFIPATSTIADATSAANIDVTYTHGAISRNEMGTRSQSYVELQLRAANESRGGKALTVSVHKLATGVLQGLALLGDEYAAPTVTSSITSDPAKRVDGDTSAYYIIDQEA